MEPKFCLHEKLKFRGLVWVRTHLILILRECLGGRKVGSLTFPKLKFWKILKSFPMRPSLHLVLVYQLKSYCFEAARHMFPPLPEGQDLVALWNKFRKRLGKFKEARVKYSKKKPLQRRLSWTTLLSHWSFFKYFITWWSEFIWG